MNEHEPNKISEEDILKAEVLGYIPEERLDSIGAGLIEKVARENPERLAATIEDLVSFHEDSSAIPWLFRHLMTKSDNKVKGALMKSAAVTSWISKNAAILHEAILQKRLS